MKHSFESEIIPIGGPEGLPEFQQNFLEDEQTMFVGLKEKAQKELAKLFSFISKASAIEVNLSKNQEVIE